MTRKLALGLLLLSLSACAKPSTIEFRTVADLPDASLVAPCDTSKRPVTLNEDMPSELSRTRKSLGECAAKVDALADWRKGAAKRGEKEPGV